MTEKEKSEINLTKAENYIAALSQYTEFLKQKEYEKAKEHLDEVETLEADIEKVWELFHKNAHQRSAVPASPDAARRLLPAADEDNQIKLVWELKPSVLPHDASAGELHIWIKNMKLTTRLQACSTQERRSSTLISSIAWTALYLSS